MAEDGGRINYNDSVLKVIKKIKVELESPIKEKESSDISAATSFGDSKNISSSHSIIRRKSQSRKSIDKLPQDGTVVNNTLEATLNSSFNQSDVSDEGRLIIADFNKSDMDLSLNNSAESATVDCVQDSCNKIATDVGQLHENELLTSRDVKMETVMSSNFNEGSCHSRTSIASDDYLPIQPEVVMSEGSDGEEITMPPVSFSLPKTKAKAKPKGKGTYMDYLPATFEFTEEFNLINWQLDKLILPPYAPTIDPPSWLKCTIPSKGFVCESCGDKFNIENSLGEHRERRSVHITLSCTYCQEDLVFYNRCVFRDHIKQHVSKDEYVNKNSVIIQPLPLEQIKLLQPIKITKHKQPYELAMEKHKPEVCISPEKIPMQDANPVGNMNGEPSVCCYMCNESFENSLQLINHLKTDKAWSDEKVECKKCRLVLPSLCSGKAHALIHSSSPDEPSICPECGNQFSNQKDFVVHLNDCGHQFRKSGIVCPQCEVCFFHFVDDFLHHWVNEHCPKYYQCSLCAKKLDTPGFHHCKFPSLQTHTTFNYILSCPTCPHTFNQGNSDERELRIKIKKHLTKAHSSLVSRVHYVFKSKFCCNAFKSKAQLNHHHESHHRKNNTFQNKYCSLFGEVQTYLRKYFDGVQQRNSFVILDSVTQISPQSLESGVLPSKHFDETVISSVSSIPEKHTSKLVKKNKSPKSASEPPPSYDKLKPVHCYKCGYVYSSMKEFKRHSKICKQDSVSVSCEACNTNLKKEDFPQHCVSHIRDDVYVCIFCCGRQFESKAHLQSHLEMHAHAQFIYPTQCIFCGFRMTDVTSALKHVTEKHEMHSLQLAHECSHCRRKFHGSKGLMIHMNKCSLAVNTSPHMIAKACNFCKRSINLEVFSKHIISHLEEKHSICCICDGWPFESRVSLLHHIEDHSLTLEYPYQCPICPFMMTDSSSCLQHLKDEHGFNKVKCPECEMTYNVWFRLQRHISIVHKASTFAKRRYICWICKAYDHIRKESVFNHFKLFHHLAIEEINEQKDIRTRGHGNLPSANFMPIRSLGKKDTLPTKRIKFISPPKSIEPPPPPSRDNGKNIVIKQEKPANLSDGMDAIDQSCLEKSPNLNDSNGVIRERRSVPKRRLILENDITPKGLDSPSDTEMRPAPLKLAMKSECGIDGPATNIDSTEAGPGSSDGIVESPYKKLKIKFVFQNKEDQKLVNKPKVVIKRIKDKYKKEKVESPIKVNKCDKPKKSFECNKCKFKTSKQSKFDQHISSHDQEKSVEGFFCGECGQSFVVKPSLDRHLFFVHKIKHSTAIKVKPPKPKQSSRANCKRSRSVDSTNSRTQNSKRRLSEVVKPPKKEFHCNVCKDNFPTSSQLYLHLKTHGMAFLKMGQKRRSIIGEG